MNEELIKRTTLTELVNAWRKAKGEIEQGFALLVVAEEGLKAAFKPESYRFDLSRQDRKYRNYKHPEELMDELKKDVWRSLVDRMELRRVLSVKRTAELETQLDTGEGLPEIDEVQILAMMEGTFNNVPQLIAEAVRETYEFLMPRRSSPSGTLKTNSQWQVGKRAIVYCLDCDKWISTPRVNYHYQPNLTAVDNVFHALDGKGTVKTHRGPLIDAIEAIRVFGAEGETDYFKFRAYRNGRLHLEFKRQDLVDQLNLVAGGGKLREKGPEVSQKIDHHYSVAV